MADIQQLERALVKADAAGDVDAARAFAAEIRKLRTTPAAAPAPAPEKSFAEKVGQGLGNLGAGLVRGAGSIGATILAPVDIINDAIDGKGLSLESNRERRRGIDGGLEELGADTDSLLYKGGKIAGEIAGTAGAGGVLANGGRALAPALAATPTGGRLLAAMASGGFRTGVPAGASLGAKAADLGIRSAGGAAAGAASAGLVNPEDAALGAGLGFALPGAAKGVGVAANYAGGKAADFLRGSGVLPAVAQLAQRAKELGINVPADRIANSKPLNALAASLNYIPGSGRAATEKTMQSQLNRALSRTFGQDTDNVTMGLRKAREELGDEFDRVLQANRVQVDQSFLNALSQAESRAQAELGADGARIIKNQIDEIMAKAAATGDIDGQAAYNIKKTLDRIGKRNSPEAFYASDLKRDLMEALNRSMTPEAAAAFAKTRQQYGNMLSLDKLAQNGVDGDVSIARIANLKNIGNKDLQELADISAQFLKGREGQHGAMQRVGLGAAGASLGGLPALAGGMAAGRAANATLNSNMLKNLMMGQPNGTQNRLLQLVGDPRLQEVGYRAAPAIAGD